MSLADIKKEFAEMQKLKPGEIDFQKLQDLIHGGGMIVKQEIEDEKDKEDKEHKEILGKLRAQLDKYSELDKIVKTMLPKSTTPSTRNSKRKTKRRERENRLFKELGIEVPVGQRLGNDLVAAGTKIKQDRKRRSRRAERQSRDASLRLML